MRPYAKLFKINVTVAYRDLGEDGADHRMFGTVRPNKEGTMKGWYLQPQSRQYSARRRSRLRRQQVAGKKARMASY